MERLFCKEKDPLVSILKDWLKAEILRIPNEQIKPLLVIERKKQLLHPRGTLGNLLTHPELFSLKTSHIQQEYMADLSGLQSRSAKLTIGVSIANNFLSGFGYNSSIGSVIEGVTNVSFSFNNVYKYYIDNGLLGKALKSQTIDRQNPATSGFFNKDKSDLLIVDSIITSNNFKIHVEDNDQVNLTVKAIEIENLFKASDTLKVEEIAKTTISFKRQMPIPFAFTCLKIELDQAGRIIGMPPIRNLPFFDSQILHTEFEKEIVSDGDSLTFLDLVD